MDTTKTIPVRASYLAPELKHHRVLILQSTSLLDGYGGIEYYLHDLSDLAAQIYGRENVLALSPLRKTPKTSFHPNYSTQAISFSKNPLLQKFQNRFSLAYWQKAKALVEKFKPTVIINGHVSIGPIAYALHQRFRLPYVSCVYGIESWGNLWPQDEWCLKHSNHIISISHWTKKILVSRGYSKSQIKIIQPRLPTDFEKVKPEKLNKDPLTLLSVSRLDANEQYKGQDHVLRALALLRNQEKSLDVKYIIQGEGTDKERLEKLTKDLGLQSQVEFRETVENRAELEKTYQQADIFIMPSRFGRWDGKWRGEGFGIVFLEAAAFGVPSIAYDCGGVTDIITDNQDGILVEPDNIEALSESILDLVKDKKKIERLAVNAREMVLSRFTRPAIRRQIIQSFNQF